MRIMIFKAALIGKESHAQGDVVECDDQRAKYLIKHGHALEVKLTGAAPSPPSGEGEGEGEVEAEEPAKREAVKKPKTRKAVLDV